MTSKEISIGWVLLLLSGVASLRYLLSVYTYPPNSFRRGTFGRRQKRSTLAAAEEQKPGILIVRSFSKYSITDAGASLDFPVGHFDLASRATTRFGST